MLFDSGGKRDKNTTPATEPKKEEEQKPSWASILR
jgi:hypothetical protein